MNKIIDNTIKFISKFTNKKIFVGKEIDIINITPIKKKIIVSKSITPLYKLKDNVGSFELYGTARGFGGITKYKLVLKLIT